MVIKIETVIVMNAKLPKQRVGEIFPPRVIYIRKYSRGYLMLIQV